MTSGRIVIAGASGFIGAALARVLVRDGHEVVALTRSVSARRGRFPEGVRPVEWDGRSAASWASSVDGALAVVNLAGDNLARGLWTKAKKDRILGSRTGAGRALVEAVREAGIKPRVLIQASAIGFYGDLGETEADEETPSGTGFLAGVVRLWEASTLDAERQGVRRVVIRSGLVLGREGGVWPRLVRPFRFFAGGPLGNGRQWLSWITLEDEVRAIRFVIGREGLSGTFNLTAPQPLREKELCGVIGKALRRPCLVRVPGFVLELLFGEKARETLLVSQRVLPRRLVAAGFEFHRPDAAAAVAALVR